MVIDMHATSQDKVALKAGFLYLVPNNNGLAKRLPC